MQVYRMTPTRGRVLIINIRDESSAVEAEQRKGSENDFVNLKHMFTNFGFIISELSGDKNWDAKVNSKQYIQQNMVSRNSTS